MIYQIRKFKTKGPFIKFMNKMHKLAFFNIIDIRTQKDMLCIVYELEQNDTELNTKAH